MKNTCFSNSDIGSAPNILPQELFTTHFGRRKCWYCDGPFYFFGDGFRRPVRIRIQGAEDV